MVGQKKIFPLIFLLVFLLDPKWVKIRIRDKHPGSATLAVPTVAILNYLDDLLASIPRCGSTRLTRPSRAQQIG